MWMIEAATGRRLAGDVEGACAAAGIDLDIDLATVARACGQEIADLIADDLRHLAPDLLRWHMPRVLSPPGAIWNWMGVLRRYPAGGGANLMVDKAWKDPVRLRLRVQIKEGAGVLPDRGTWRYHLHRSPQPWVPHGDLIHCYRLSELAGGRSTVTAVPWRRAAEGGELSVKPCGQSLLAVVHEYLSARHRLNEWEIMQPWNRGAGSIDDMEVEESRESVAKIEALRRRLGDRTRPTEK
ncbi:hypothetical protein GCM10010404_04830 [Nonomuraea africana]|uniref:Uncharacterized protein n=1 Tax=Nonomuraea africana TaxID=46171 RepID=A0ABR9KAW4_9ACTN|nr:hypothetical protein [Nonomuraea africana]MBE1559134.1 hypothetical protein [Nonomuraea africana]